MSRPQELDHLGTVVAVEEGMATVHFVRSSACKSCGVCLVAGDSQMEVKAKDEIGVKPGDRVVVTMLASTMLKASAMCYAVPLGLLLVGTYLGSLISDVWAAVIGLGSCALSFLLLRLVERKIKHSQRFVPQITRIAEENENV